MGVALDAVFAESPPGALAVGFQRIHAQIERRRLLQTATQNQRFLYSDLLLEPFESPIG